MRASSQFCHIPDAVYEMPPVFPCSDATIRRWTAESKGDSVVRFGCLAPAILLLKSDALGASFDLPEAARHRQKERNHNRSDNDCEKKDQNWLQQRKGGCNVVVHLVIVGFSHFQEHGRQCPGLLSDV